MRLSLLLCCLVLMTCKTRDVNAAIQLSPEEVVDKALDALNHGKLDVFARAMHPDALQKFQEMTREIADLAVKLGKENEMLATFQGVNSVDQLKGMDASALVVALFAKATADPDAKKALAATRIDTIGRIVSGPDKDKAYVVYRSRMKFGQLTMDRLNVASLLKSGSDWKLSLLDDVAAQFATLKQNLIGVRELPDLKESVIEPLGHILEGKKTALVVYRSTFAVGNGSISKLAVLSVPSTDSAWDDIRKGNNEVVQSVIEKKLGVHKPLTPEVIAARREAVLEATKAQHERLLSRLPKQPNRPPLPNFAPDPAPSETLRTPELPPVQPFPNPVARNLPSPPSRPTRQAAASEPASDLPAGLSDHPPKFFGGNRDRFHDLAPTGGVLVGVRVTYIQRFGGSKIRSVQPVFRVNDKLVDGHPHGQAVGPETQAIAKTGYAVGAIYTHTGITVDGFELVFMKVDGDKLDPADTYTSPWLGDRKGGSPRDATTDGKLPLGLQGRAGEELNALGLTVKE